MTEGLIPHFRRLAQYNRLANERVYDVCSVLTDKERKQSRSGFFGSIHGTLNHILRRRPDLDDPVRGRRGAIYESRLDPL